MIFNSLNLLKLIKKVIDEETIRIMILIQEKLEGPDIFWNGEIEGNRDTKSYFGKVIKIQNKNKNRFFNFYLLQIKTLFLLIF